MRTCLQTDVCDERCKYELECVEDCSSGLLWFGFSKCKNLSRKC